MKLIIDYSKEIGPIKRMNAVNNGPVYRTALGNPDKRVNNLEAYKAANVPFARTHDASFCSSYGGEHTVDVNCIFTNFDADPNDPEAYDFIHTDEYLNSMLLAGTQPFYRLGCKIEGHLAKRYAANPPKDFYKWAVICEHIIAHYNEGWANGFHMNIIYWEIWNEPDAGLDNPVLGANWAGTREQYFDLYTVASRHLKQKFPYIKVGGPVTCCMNEEWMHLFLQKCKDENLPLDFYSWHYYNTDVSRFIFRINLARQILDQYGFTKTENILNEWNYVTSFLGTGASESCEIIQSMKGAAFASAIISACQDAPLDMLMYYDWRPFTGYNGAFYGPMMRIIKGYYPIKTWGELRTLGTQVYSSCDIPDIYVTAAKSESEEKIVITYYTNKEDTVPYTFSVELQGMADRPLKVYLLDEEHDMTRSAMIFPDNGHFTLTMQPNTVLVIK